MSMAEIKCEPNKNNKVSSWSSFFNSLSSNESKRYDNATNDYKIGRAPSAATRSHVPSTVQATIQPHVKTESTSPPLSYRRPRAASFILPSNLKLLNGAKQADVSTLKLALCNTSAGYFTARQMSAQPSREIVTAVPTRSIASNTYRSSTSSQYFSPSQPTKDNYSFNRATSFECVSTISTQRSTDTITNETLSIKHKASSPSLPTVRKGSLLANTTKPVIIPQLVSTSMNKTTWKSSLPALQSARNFSDKTPQLHSSVERWVTAQQNKQIKVLHSYQLDDLKRHFDTLQMQLDKYEAIAKKYKAIITQQQEQETSNAKPEESNDTKTLIYTEDLIELIDYIPKIHPVLEDMHKCIFTTNPSRQTSSLCTASFKALPPSNESTPPVKSDQPPQSEMSFVEVKKHNENTIQNHVETLHHEYLYSLQIENMTNGQIVARCVDVISIAKEPTVLLMTEFLTKQECEKISQAYKSQFDQNKSNEVLCNIQKSLRRRLAAILKIDKSEVETFEIIERTANDSIYYHSIPYNHAYVIAFLNEVPKGGIMEFKSLNLRITPRLGMAVVWMNSVPTLEYFDMKLMPPSIISHLLLCQLKRCVNIDNIHVLSSLPQGTSQQNRKLTKANQKKSKLPPVEEEATKKEKKSLIFITE